MRHGVGTAVVLLGTLALSPAALAGPTSGIDCEAAAALHMERQTNQRAAEIVAACAGSPHGAARVKSAGPIVLAPGSPLADLLGGSDLNVVTGTETHPSVTQAESATWGSGSTIVVAYNDSSDAPSNYSGISTSTDGGANFTRLLPSPLATGFGTNLGGPAVVFNDASGLWIAASLATGCGGQGIATWTSTDGLVWSAGACAHSGTADDRPSMWVDNDVASAFYGRTYVSFNDFAVGGGALHVAYADPAGAWTTAAVTAGFVRNVQITGHPDSSGLVYIAGMDEGGGAGASRVNHIYRSVVGGSAWTPIVLTPSFPAPGAGLCAGSTYFYMIPPVWRHMGWGQIAAGPAGVVHLVFCRAGQVPGDLGDVYYQRSTDTGISWGAPIPLNSDQALNNNVVQWIPSISVTSQGYVLAAWYDKRNTTDGENFEYFGRVSLDNGATWLLDEPISDVAIPQPAQPDPDVNYCYAGESNSHTTLAQASLATWTDGRNQVNGENQQDVYFDRVLLCPPMSVDPPALPGAVVGTAYAQTLTVTGGTAPYTFALSGTLPTGLALDTGTGDITGTPTTPQIASFTVTATDAAGCTASRAYWLIVEPPGCPAITVNPATLPSGTQGAPYSATITATGGASPYTFEVTGGALPLGLTLDAATGVIDGSPMESGQYPVDITAVDANECTGTTSYTIDIACAFISLSPVSGQLPEAYAGIPYLVQITANGGTAPYRFEQVTSSLPDGIFLGEGGTLWGIPTQGGTRNFTIVATDVNGCTGTQSFSFTSANCFPGALVCESFNGGLNTMTATDQCGSRAQWYGENNCFSSDDIGHTASHHARWGMNGDCGTYTTGQTEDYLESAVLNVARCNSGSVVFGFNYLLSYENNDPATERARVEVMVDGGAPQVVADNGAGGPTCAGTASTGVGGIGPASGWRRASFTIPADGTFQVRFVGESDGNGSDKLGEGFLVDDVLIQCLCPEITLTPDILPNGTVNVAYSQTVVAAGGQPAYTWSITDGNLPAGLALDPLAGTIAGLPTQPGIFTFTLTATDSNFCIGELIYTIVISPASCPAITVSPATLPNGEEGVFYSQTVTATGGVPPYTYFVTAGVLPPGLALDPDTGVISGTPTTSGAYPFDITAVDDLFCTGSTTYLVVITLQGCPPITITPTTLPNGDLGVPYSQQMTANGGIAPYSWSAVGNLPPGLALDPASGLLSGTPTSIGTFAFTIVATDQNGCIGASSYTILVDPRPPVDYVVGEGLGDTNTNLVRVYDGAGNATSVQFPAYGAGKWGTNVASGDLDGDATGEIVTGPGPGDVYGPQVRGFKNDGTSMGKINFYAYGTLKYGVNVASGDIEGDGYDEILSGAGPGEVFGPHVRGWNFDGTGITSVAKINFFAYGTLKYGVNVGRADVEADTFDELLTAPGPGLPFGPTIRGFNYDGVALTAIAKINFGAFSLTTYGANVAGGDLDTDGYDEIAATPGPGPTHPSEYRGFDFDGGPIVAMPGFPVTAFTTLFGGRVGAGDVSQDGQEELLCGAGRDPAASSLVKAYDYGTGTPTQLPGAFTPFGNDYGVNVTAGYLGF